MSVIDKGGGLDYCESFIKPPGAYLILAIPAGGLKERGHIREGGLINKKSNDMDIYDSYLVLLHYVLRIQYTFLQVKYIDSTQFYPKTTSNPTCKLV